MLGQARIPACLSACSRSFVPALTRATILGTLCILLVWLALSGKSLLRVDFINIFERNFGSKNYKAAFWVWNFLAPKYWRKKCVQNVDEIASHSPDQIWEHQNWQCCQSNLRRPHLVQRLNCNTFHHRPKGCNLWRNRPLADFINVLRARFSYIILGAKTSNPNHSFVIFGAKILYKKIASVKCWWNWHLPFL